MYITQRDYHREHTLVKYATTQHQYGVPNMKTFKNNTSILNCVHGLGTLVNLP